MATQREQNHKDVKAGKDIEDSITAENAQVKPKKVHLQDSAKEKAQQKTNDTLTKVQQALKTTQAKLKLERKARAKAEKALAEAEKALKAARLNTDQEHQVQIRRISFVVRLIIGEHGKPLRTEIEQVETSRKQNFLGLDGERLVAFMKAYINPIIIPEDLVETESSLEGLTTLQSGLNSSKSGLIVSDVQVFQVEDPDNSTLFIPQNEPFIIQVRFLIQGSEAKTLIFKESKFKIKVYANEIFTGKSMLIRTYSAAPIRNILEYTAPVEMHGLSPGLYRLSTIIILQTTPILAGFYGKTIIHVV